MQEEGRQQELEGKTATRSSGKGNREEKNIFLVINCRNKKRRRRRGSDPVPTSMLDCLPDGSGLFLLSLRPAQRPSTKRERERCLLDLIAVCVAAPVKNPSLKLTAAAAAIEGFLAAMIC